MRENKAIAGDAIKVEKRQQLAGGMEKKEAETKQEQAVATERKGMTTRSRRPSAVDDETASKSQKVEEGDQATKPKVSMMKCSQEFIDQLLSIETKNAIRPVSLSLLDGYTGSRDLRGPMLRCQEALQKMLDSHAEFLRQYRANGEAYYEVVDEDEDEDEPIV